MPADISRYTDTANILPGSLKSFAIIGVSFQYYTTTEKEKLYEDQNFRHQNSIKINVILNSIKNPLQMVCSEGIFQCQIRRMFFSTTLYHADLLRQVQQTTVCPWRQSEYSVLSPFFPRSVGLWPTASRANGAFTIQPSTLCHSQPIPFSLSYSSNAIAHNFSKKPAASHS